MNHILINKLPINRLALVLSISLLAFNAPGYAEEVVEDSTIEDPVALEGGYTLPDAAHSATADNATNADNSITANSANSASTADTALNALQLGGEAMAFFLNADNLNSGTIDANRLNGYYNIDVANADFATASNGGGATSPNYQVIQTKNSGLITLSGSTNVINRTYGTPAGSEYVSIEATCTRNQAESRNSQMGGTISMRVGSLFLALCSTLSQEAGGSQKTTNIGSVVIPIKQGDSIVVTFGKTGTVTSTGLVLLRYIK